MSEAQPGVSEAAFWQRLYETEADRWELGGPAPPLVEHLARHPHPPGERVAVPGCGRGHDARFLARAGFRVWAFDFAEPAVRAARALAAQARVAISVERRDVFDLLADYRGFFDGVWEYTSFCAIDPRRRPEYVRVIHGLLRPGGWLLACFFPVREGSGGPPFPVTREEVRRLFEPWFTVLAADVPGASAPGRSGLEWLVVARARSAEREA